MTPWRLLAAGSAMVLLAGFAIATVSAAESVTRPAASTTRLPTLTPRPTPTTSGLLAIAIGQLQEGDGGVATVDLHAATKDGQTGGNLRFYSDDGYYNGGVNQLSVESGVIRVAGGGGLLQPSGHRVNVAYTAEITIATKHVTMHIHGPGVDYTLDGVLNPGLVMGGPPPA